MLHNRTRGLDDSLHYYGQEVSSNRYPNLDKSVTVDPTYFFGLDILSIRYIFAYKSLDVDQFCRSVTLFCQTCLEKNMNASKPISSEHPPNKGQKMSLGGWEYRL